ncbi:hypothetical protein ACFL5Z_11320 [Planctomycetota bacterium]
MIVLLLVFGTMIAAYTKGVQTKTLREAMDRELDFSKLSWGDLEMEVSGSDSKDTLAALRVLRDRYVTAQEEISQLNHQLGEKKPPVAVRHINLRLGPPMAFTALVRRPFLPEGVQSWTLETYGHRGSVTRLAYSPDGSELISVGGDGTVRTWDAETGKLTKILVDPNKIVDLPQFADSLDAGRFSWSVDQSAPGVDEIITLWEVDLPDVWQPLLRTTATAALSPDRAMLAFGDRDGMIRVVDLKTGRLRYSNTLSWCGPVHSVRFSSDGKVLATCSGSGIICLWDAHRWQPLRKFEAENITSGFPIPTNMVAWSPSDALIARPNNRRDALEILDSQSGQMLRALSGDSQKITSISWSPDGTFLAVGTVDGKAHLWDVESNSNKPFITLDAHAGGVNGLAWRPEDRGLITAGEDGKIEIWEPRSGTQTKSLQRSIGPIACLALSSNGQILASGTHDGTIRLWDAEVGQLVNILRNEPNDTQAKLSAFSAVAWSPDGTLLASGDSGGNIRIWALDSRQPTHSFGANCGPISSLAWSPDGRMLICGGADGTARVWDVKNDFREHVVLLPLWGSLGPGIAINREGDYRGPPGIADHLAYVVMTERGQETLTRADFKSRFGWLNEPWQVGLFAPGAEQVKRIYVKADAQSPHDGNSWDTAFNNLQDALKLAQPDTEIWVAGGIYTPDRGTGAREASFHLKNGVRLFGGFAGAETSSHHRDPNENETILSGDLKGDDGPNFANYDENSYHVVFASDSESSTVLDGFVITGGNANGPSSKQRGDYRNRHGGGLFVENCRPALINCTFRYNFAVQHGGGIFSSSGRPIIQNCTFAANRASYHGGAICSHWSKGVVSRSTFIENLADVGGGGAYLLEDNSTFIDCIFTGNSGSSYGGGLYVVFPECNVILTNCSFLRNTSDNGAGLFTRSSSPRLNNCLFNNNLAANRGGGIFVCYDTLASNPLLANCTIVRNESLYPGFGIYSDPNCSPVLENCIMWNNIGGNSDRAESIRIHGGSPVINNCCIQGWTSKLGGTGNFGLDPLFVDPNGPDGKIGTLDDNLRLDLASPCRDAGDNSALGADTTDLDKDGDVREPIPFDIEGKPRILNSVVDLGAFESG